MSVDHLYDDVAKHVSEEELADALNPDIGDGTPDTAPEKEYIDPDWVQTEGTHMPTRKWLAARVTALAGLIVLFIAHSWHFDEHTVIPLGAFIAEALVSYGVTNDPTPGGVPENNRSAGYSLVEMAFALLVLIIAAAILLTVID